MMRASYLGEHSTPIPSFLAQPPQPTVRSRCSQTQRSFPRCELARWLNLRGLSSFGIEENCQTERGHVYLSSSRAQAHISSFAVLRGKNDFLNGDRFLVTLLVGNLRLPKHLRVSVRRNSFVSLIDSAKKPNKIGILDFLRHQRFFRDQIADRFTH